MTAEVLVRELQRPVVNPDWERMPPPPPPAGRAGGVPIDPSRGVFPFTVADRASVAADLDSVIKVLIDIMHFYPQWGKN